MGEAESAVLQVATAPSSSLMVGWQDSCYHHNFAFWLEIHSDFKYNGGETFKFSGDDDVCLLS